MNHLQVVGNPIAHSWSPQIHTAFAAQFDRSIDYEKCLVPVQGFNAHAAEFFAAGGHGMNVTVPFKEDAHQFVDQLSAAAQWAGAVNTICVASGKLHGHNTDGIGLVNDLTQRWQFELSGATVLLLGAGGSTRGLLKPLIDAGVKELCIANRTASKAQTLVTKVRTEGISSHLLALPVTQTKEHASFDLVINTTSIGLTDGVQLNDLCAPELLSAALCYDLSYGASAKFARMAHPHAARSVDGLGMLVEQAAQSFYLWFTQRPLTEPVYQTLRAQTDAQTDV